MDNLLIIAIAVAIAAILANLSVVYGVDSREGFGRLDHPGLS